MRVVHTHHSLAAIKYEHVQRRPTIAETRLDMERQIVEQADCVIATSPHEREFIRRFMTEKGRIEVIPCGVDPARFQPQSKIAARAQLAIDPAARMILYVGRLDPRKGIDTLVHACSNTLVRRFEPLRLFIVGGTDSGRADDAEKKRISQIVVDENLVRQTVFTGAIDHDVLPKYYAAADVCVVPSYYEPFGIVALEAMACGVPVIASAVGGLNFTVRPNETGVLVPPKDTKALAAALHRMMSNEPRAHRMGAAAAAFVRQNFTWNIVTTKLNELYEELLHS